MNDGRPTTTLTGVEVVAAGRAITVLPAVCTPEAAVTLKPGGPGHQRPAGDRTPACGRLLGP